MRQFRGGLQNAVWVQLELEKGMVEVISQERNLRIEAQALPLRNPHHHLACLHRRRWRPGEEEKMHGIGGVLAMLEFLDSRLEERLSGQEERLGRLEERRQGGEAPPGGSSPGYDAAWALGERRGRTAEKP